MNFDSRTVRKFSTYTVVLNDLINEILAGNDIPQMDLIIDVVALPFIEVACEAATCSGTTWLIVDRFVHSSLIYCLSKEAAY